jgi:hypothetical protein
MRNEMKLSEGRRHSSMCVINVNGCINRLLNFKNKKGGYKILKRPLIFYSGMFSCLLVLLMFTFMSAGCEKPDVVIPSNEEDNNTIETIDSCQWQVIQPLKLDTIAETKFNQLFSNQNFLLPKFNDNSMLYLVDNNQDFSLICNDTSLIMQIDFSKSCIVWGMYQAPAIPYTVSAKELSFCLDNISYKYNIYIQKCTECYEAIETLYYWEIYPSINQNILLNINILSK